MGEQTVFIIDDDEAVCDSIQELVSSVKLPAETFHSAQAFLDGFDATRAGCLVLDVRMAHMSGLALQAKLAELGAEIPIVFISGHGDITTAVTAVKAGAVDFVQKPYQAQQLLDAINEALRRDAAKSAAKSDRGDFAARLAALTERERDVMALSMKGMSSKLIAQQLGISHRTVELHRSRVLEKFGAASMAELISLSQDRQA
ncbi:response regulator transcription factor [Variovorax sp. LARHSF232]